MRAAASLVHADARSGMDAGRRNTQRGSDTQQASSGASVALTLPEHQHSKTCTIAQQTRHGGGGTSAPCRCGRGAGEVCTARGVWCALWARSSTPAAADPVANRGGWRAAQERLPSGCAQPTNSPQTAHNTQDMQPTMEPPLRGSVEMQWLFILIALLSVLIRCADTLSC